MDAEISKIYSQTIRLKDEGPSIKEGNQWIHVDSIVVQYRIEQGAFGSLT